MWGNKYFLYDTGVGEHRAVHSISVDQRSQAHRPRHAVFGTHSIIFCTFLEFSINYPSLRIRILPKNSLCGFSWKIRPRNSEPAFLSDNQRLELESHPGTPKMPYHLYPAVHVAALLFVTLSHKLFTFYKSTLQTTPVTTFYLQRFHELIRQFSIFHCLPWVISTMSHLVRMVCSSRWKIKLNSTQDIELCSWDKDKIS